MYNLYQGCNKGNKMWGTELRNSGSTTWNSDAVPKEICLGHWSVQHFFFFLVWLEKHEILSDRIRTVLKVNRSWRVGVPKECLKISLKRKVCDVKRKKRRSVRRMPVWCLSWSIWLFPLHKFLSPNSFDKSTVSSGSISNSVDNLSKKNHLNDLEFPWLEKVVCTKKRVEYVSEGVLESFSKKLVKDFGS